MLGLLGAAFLFLGDNASAADQAQAFPFFVFDNGLNGIQDPPRVLKELGYQGVGVRALDIGGLIQSYEQAGLKVFSTYVGCRLDQTPPYDPSFKEQIAKLKGTDVILWLTVLGGKRGQEDAKAAAVVREIADMAAAANLRVALYPHTGFYVATTADALRVAKQVDRPNVGVSINLCHELMTDQGPQLDATIREALPQLMLVSDQRRGRQAAGLQLGPLDPAAGPRQLRRVRFPQEAQDRRLQGTDRPAVLRSQRRPAGEPEAVDQSLEGIPGAAGQVSRLRRNAFGEDGLTKDPMTKE